MNKFNFSSIDKCNLKNNAKHKFAVQFSMMLYKKKSLYTFIPKNACSTLRLSVAIENGCIDDIEQGHWIHANNQSFNATLPEAINAEYSFVVLRCPLMRLASLFLNKFVNKEPDAWQYKAALGHKIDLDNLTFREFILSLKERSLLRLNIHWRPQVDFLLYEQYSDYFSLENFKQAISTLKEKIGFEVIDARALTNHGTDKLKLLDDRCYADTPAFDMSVLKRQGSCPSHASLYDKELYQLVSELYSDDIALYKEKCDPSKLLKIQDVCSPILDIDNVTIDDVKYPFDVDFLRDEAVRIENESLTKAHHLMSLAYKARPNGPFIKAKFEEYQQLLAEKSGS